MSKVVRVITTEPAAAAACKQGGGDKGIYREKVLQFSFRFHSLRSVPVGRWCSGPAGCTFCTFGTAFQYTYY